MIYKSFQQFTWEFKQIRGFQIFMRKVLTMNPIKDGKYFEETVMGLEVFMEEE